MKRRACLLMALAALVAATAKAGYVEEWARMKSLLPRGYVCFRATNTIVADGKLSEPTWRAAPWTLDFVDIEGDTNAVPRLRTRAKMLWSYTNLYVAAELEEPHVWGRQKGRGADPAADNCFIIFIDPDGDGHTYYEIAINALGAVGTSLHDKPPKDGGASIDLSQFTGLRAGVRVNGSVNSAADRDESWTIEVTIPWLELALYAGRECPPSNGDQWRVNFCRVEWTAEKVGTRYRKVEGSPASLWVWSPQGVRDMQRPEKWGCVQFSRKRGTRARFIPDPALAARGALQEVYYFQKDFQPKHGRWASSLAELGVEFRPSKGLENAPVVQLTPEGFEATVDGPLQGLKPLRWHISQDGRFWADPELGIQIQRYYQTVPDTNEEP